MNVDARDRPVTVSAMAARASTARALTTTRVRSYLAVGAVCLLGVVLVSRGITDEGAVSLDGDMPHYLLNGAFLYDVLHDAPLRAPLEYAERYYARYPALTLGHHPFVPALAEIPFFWAFGVSVFAARLATASAFALLLVFWMSLVRQVYDTTTAVFSSLLLISTPGIIPLFQIVLSEPFTLCLIVLSLYFMQRYCATGRAGAGVAFALCVVLSAYAKHLAVFIFPVYAFQLASAFGIRRLFSRSTLITAVCIGVCLLPLVAVTLKYAQWNVAIVTQFVKPGQRTSSTNFMRVAQWLWEGQFRLTIPVLVLAGVAVAGAAVTRDRRILLFVTWAASVYVGLLLMGVTNNRFFCYWMPAFCALAAAVVQLASTPRWRTAWTMVLIATVGYQFWTSAADAATPMKAAARPAGATGYEEAARYVSENRLGDTILYSAAVDTGYFVFFVRKANPTNQLVVLRSDKVLTTARMGYLNFKLNVSDPSEILPILQKYGVGYVVIEDRPFPDGPLRWLQNMVQTSDFAMRKRIPIKSTDLRMDGATLSIYEYKARVPAAADVSLSIGVPLMNGVIQVPLADLVRSPNGR